MSSHRTRWPYCRGSPPADSWWYCGDWPLLSYVGRWGPPAEPSACSCPQTVVVTIQSVWRGGSNVMLKILTIRNFERLKAYSNHVCIHTPHPQRPPNGRSHTHTHARTHARTHTHTHTHIHTHTHTLLTPT